MVTACNEQKVLHRVLTIFLRYVFLGLSRPVTEGCLISVSRRGAGSGGRDMTLHRRCGAGARRSKPHLSGRVPVARRRLVTAGRWNASVTEAPPSAWPEHGGISSRS